MDKHTYINTSAHLNFLSEEEFLEIVVKLINEQMLMAEGAKYTGHWARYKNKSFLQVYSNTIKDVNLNDKLRAAWNISSRLGLDFEFDKFVRFINV